MYEAFYGLKERPFSLTPDPRFLFLSEKHKEAFAHLLYGIKNRNGFVMVTGEIGTGKTTICRTLLGQLDEDTEVAFIFNPYLSPEELLGKINEDFGIDTRATSFKGLTDELNEYLLAKAAEGKNCVLVIDEAQNLAPAVLEHVRLLSNLETETQKLLQIVLIGQPELMESLALPQLRQLNQRITARYHLKPLDSEETLQYIAYRLRVAGGRKQVRFTRRAVDLIYRYSGGTPRVINAIADRALLIGYTREARDITVAIVKQAYREVRGEEMKPRKHAESRQRPIISNTVALVAGAALLLIGIYLFDPSGRGDDSRIATAQPAPTQAVDSAPSAPSAEDTLTVEVASLTPDLLDDQPKGDAVEPEPEEPSFTQMLDQLDRTTSRNAASVSLLRAWGTPLQGEYPVDDTVASLSAFAAANGLTAESFTPALEQLETLGLPAYVRVAGDRQNLWVALLRLDETVAEVSTGMGESFTVPRDEFAKRYLTQAVVLWRDDAPAATILREPMQGPEVRTLQERLAATGRFAGEPTGFYGPQTTDAVRALQIETGLKVDGMVGRQTRMVLASWTMSETPGLNKAITVETAPTEEKSVDLAQEPVPAPVEPPVVEPAVVEALDAAPVPVPVADFGPPVPDSVASEASSPADTALPEFGDVTIQPESSDVDTEPPAVEPADATAPVPDTSEPEPLEQNAEVLPVAPPTPTVLVEDLADEPEEVDDQAALQNDALLVTPPSPGGMPLVPHGGENPAL